MPLPPSSSSSVKVVISTISWSEALNRKPYWTGALELLVLLVCFALLSPSTSLLLLRTVDLPI